MKITRPIRAVLFDMDGVMVDSEFVYMKYLLEFAKEKNPAVTMEDINQMVGRSRQDSWTVMERAVNNGETWETLIQGCGPKETFTAGIDYRKIFRPEMKTTVQELKAPRLYSRTGILHRSEADLEDRGGGGHAPGI